MPTPDISIVIPVFNEERLIETAVRALTNKLQASGWSFEIILAENGSSDATPQIAESLSEQIAQVSTFSIGSPNYGAALRQGIERARAPYVVCDEVDLLDISFYHRALPLLTDGADLVVGSKRHPESRDARPWTRRQGTKVINAMLRVALDFKGTDTHGPKALKKNTVLAVVGRCVIEHNLFASELVIRAAREGLRVTEVPLTLREIRPPSVGLAARVPRVLGDLARLIVVIRST